MEERPSAFEKPAGRVQGTSQDPFKDGRWLWAKVTVGKGDVVYTYGNGRKRFTFCFLLPESCAVNGNPRGYEEIGGTSAMRLHSGTIILSDKWKTTRKAIRARGFDPPPGIDHGEGYRDRETGLHANVIESENARLKGWARHRYSRSQLSELDLHEYAFYVNVGQSMSAVLSAFDV